MMNTSYLLQDARGTYYPINGPTMIGQDPACQVRVSDPDVSRNHALFWMVRHILYLRDENTPNGTYLNEWRIPPGKPIAVIAGSRVCVGQTIFTVASIPQPPVHAPEPVAAPVPLWQRPSRFMLFLFSIAAGMCVGLFFLAAWYFILRPQASRPASQNFRGMTVLATSAPQPLLSHQAFAAANDNLALSLARLNTAELVFIRQAGAANPSPQVLDDALCEVAAQAMNIALLAEKQGYNAASQGANSAEYYYSSARLGYALVLEAQNLRSGLQKQAVSPLQALKTIAQYGSRLWNPLVSDPVTKGNPFLSYASDFASLEPQFLSDTSVAQLKTQLGPNSSMVVWLAASKEGETIDVYLPEMGPPLTQHVDPGVLQSLTQASAQANANLARQAAAAKLSGLLPDTGQFLGGSASASIQLTVFKRAAIADANQAAAGKMPTFAKGQASALAKQTGAGNEFVDNLYTLTGEAAPVQTESTLVKETQPVVTLQITGARETSRMKSPLGTLGVYDVQIAWQSAFIAPMLDIGCMGGSTQRVTVQNGAIKVSASAYIDHQTNQVSIQCRASRPASFINSVADIIIVLTVPDSQNVELAPLPPTLTDTRLPTITMTLPPPATPTPNMTQQALSIEVAIEKTAEFASTITAIAAQTQQAVQLSIFTMNGTFGITQPGQACDPGLHSSGTLLVTVNFGTGAASGTLTGGGSASNSDVVCGNVTYDLTCNQTYSGSFSGSVDPASGVLSMSGNASGQQSCNYSNCKQDGLEISCQNQSMNFSSPVNITGSVIQSSGTGKGALQTCPGCQGDWSAGK